MDGKETSSYPNLNQSWGIFGIIIFLSLIIYPFGFLLGKVVDEELAFSISYILIFSCSFLWIHRIRKIRTGESNFNFSNSSGKIMVLVTLASITIPIGFSLPLMSMIPIPEWAERIIFESGEENVFTYITIVIAAPVLEELIFTGIILNGFLSKYSPLKSIFFASFLFGLIHLNPWQFVNAMITGLFSGWVYYRTGKLSLCIFIHFVNNFFASLTIYFSDPEVDMNQTLVEAYGGIGTLIIITLTAIIIVGTCIFLLFEEFENGEKVIWRPAYLAKDEEVESNLTAS